MADGWVVVWFTWLRNKLYGPLAGHQSMVPTSPLHELVEIGVTTNFYETTWETTSPVTIYSHLQRCRRSWTWSQSHVFESGWNAGIVESHGWRKLCWWSVNIWETKEKYWERKRLKPIWEDSIVLTKIIYVKYIVNFSLWQRRDVTVAWFKKKGVGLVFKKLIKSRISTTQIWSSTIAIPEISSLSS